MIPHVWLFAEDFSWSKKADRRRQSWLTNPLLFFSFSYDFMCVYLSTTASHVYVKKIHVNISEGTVSDLTGQASCVWRVHDTHIPLVLYQNFYNYHFVPLPAQTSHTAPPSAQRMRLREATRLRGSAPLPHLPHLRERHRPTPLPPSRAPDLAPGRPAKAPPHLQPWQEPRRGAPNQLTWDGTSGTGPLLNPESLLSSSM